MINSREYWNERFNTNWRDFNGNEQTKFFASMLNSLLPEWLIYEINENSYPVCDLGCAEGDALPIYKQVFITSKICGEDFSEKAVELARENYPVFDFKVSNIFEPDREEKYPVVICSNVVEHFKETYRALECICKRAEKYAIILIPYREPLGAIEEHERTFHTRDIPLQIGDNCLVYAKSTCCASVLYPYEQILLVYAKGKKFTLLSDLAENISSDREARKDALIADREKKITEAGQTIAEKDQLIAALEDTAAQKDTELEQKKLQIQEYLQKNALLKKTIASQENSAHSSKTTITNMQAELNQLGAELSMSKAVLRQKDEYMVQAQVMCDQFATGKLMKLNHFLYRFKGQLLQGNKETRAEFWSWLKGRINHTNRSLGEGVFYNPWMTVRKKLNDGVACRIEMSSTVQTTSVDNVESLDISFENDKYQLLPETREILTKEYQNYDVIILSVIDYNFRHQRPQHFATRFAANGHRVFYVNANFVRPDRIVTEAENLYIVDFSCNVGNAIYTMNGKAELEWMKQKFNRLIFEQAICDAIVIVDYPNWVYGAEYLRSHYGFKMITDYMDDYTGFLSTTEDFLKENCTYLLKQSDLVVASSQFLFDVACKYTEKEKITIIRNGTEVEHFYQATEMKQTLKERKIIGYYGAVAHWFAWEKVCYLANVFPDCDIVIVGDVTEYRDKLSKFSNIKLLGEKPYTELPCYLADFDVCLIPFDTSTDLIKATNPVKFYEYLSAGKKIVATEIPELMPYRDEYVYMSNDDKQFAEYVKMCLDGTDLLKPEEKCIAFARENDWQERYVQLEATCQSAVPMVSIIVLTYNNLELNKKCFDSIISQTAYANYELIIVDNCSTDGTVEYLKELDARQYPNVRVILNEENTGFAEGNNIGIRAARGQYILLLNNDTVVSRGWLTSLTKHLENNVQYGMCNPTTNSIGNESMIIARYTNLEEMREFAYTTAARHMGEEYHDVNRLPLFATLIRKSAIDQIGMLDTEYKVGMFEDDDFTERMIRADYQIVIADDVFIHHVNNGSFKKLSDDEYKKIFETNKALFEKKWNRKWTIPKYRKGVTATINEGCHI